MMKAGYTEKQIGKAKIALKFGTNAFAELCEMHDRSDMNAIDEILNSASGVRDLIFCAGKVASLAAGKDFKFNKYQIGDWLDEMSEADYADILKTMRSTRVLGQGVEVEKK